MKQGRIHREPSEDLNLYSVVIDQLHQSLVKPLLQARETVCMCTFRSVSYTMIIMSLTPSSNIVRYFRFNQLCWCINAVQDRN